MHLALFFTIFYKQIFKTHTKRKSKMCKFVSMRCFIFTHNGNCIVPFFLSFTHSFFLIFFIKIFIQSFGKSFFNITLFHLIWKCFIIYAWWTILFPFFRKSDFSPRWKDFIYRRINIIFGCLTVEVKWPASAI